MKENKENEKKLFERTNEKNLSSSVTYNVLKTLNRSRKS